MLPIVPRRSRSPVVLAIGAVAAVLIGAGAWYRLAGRSPRAGDRDHQGNDLSALLARPAEAALRAEVAATPLPVATAPATAAPLPGGDEPTAASVAGEATAAAAPAAAPARAAVAEVAAPGAGRTAPGRTAPSVKPPPPVRPVLRRGVKPHLPAGAELAASATQVALTPASAEAPVPAAEPGIGAGASPVAGPERAAEPLPMPSPAPAPPPPPAGPPQVAAAPRSLDAVPEIASFELQGSLATSVARRGVERALPGLRACYAAAARAGREAPAIELRLSFEIDENSLATHVAAGDLRFGSFARCAAGVAGQIHTTQAPDVGTAHVVAVIKFHPS